MKAARPAVQKRSIKTRDAVVNALESLLEKKPMEYITIAELADTAGVSVGTIYRRFDGKNALREALLELYEIRMQVWISDPENHSEIPDGATLSEALLIVAQQAWSQILAMPALLRAAIIVSQSDPELFRTRFEPLLAQGYGGLVQLLEHYEAEIGHSDAEKACRMVFYFFQTIMLDQGLFPGSLGQFGPPEDADFPREIAAFAYGYLTGDGLASVG